MLVFDSRFHSSKKTFNPYFCSHFSFRLQRKPSQRDISRQRVPVQRIRSEVGGFTAGAQHRAGTGDAVAQPPQAECRTRRPRAAPGPPQAAVLRAEAALHGEERQGEAG